MIDTTEIIVGGVGIISTIVAGWSGWFFSRKKYNSEVENNLIENLLKGLDFYKLLCDDNTERLADLVQRNEALTNEVNELSAKVHELTLTVLEYRRSNEELKAELCKYTMEQPKIESTYIEIIEEENSDDSNNR